MLPVTLVSGIFGMNVGGLPFIKDASGFGWTMLLMSATLVTTVLVLRWRRLL
jgi:zinc transporter